MSQVDRVSSIARLARGAVGLLCAVMLSACGVLSASHRARPSSASAPSNASPPKTVAARRLRPAASAGLRPGTAVRRDFTGVRVFATSRVGFAITDLPRATGGTYPVVTLNGGRTWRIDGPVLHVPAAQGPLAVSQAAVLGPKIYFAWCGACNMVIDVTPDAGMHWWQTFMPGEVLAVVGGPDPRAGLMAIIEGPTSASNGRGASVWVYSSTDGRRWTYEYSLSAVS